MGGFTLIEVMVVLAVMGLLLGLVLTRGPQRSPTLELRAAASRVAQALRLARTQAIATDRPVRFIVDPARHAFGAEGKIHILPGTIALSGPKGGIVFEPDGSASSGVIGVALGRLRAVVTVDWLTGQVSVG